MRRRARGLAGLTDAELADLLARVTQEIAARLTGRPAPMPPVVISGTDGGSS
ncbi:MAG: hypothetical protein ACRDPY_34265 [Streptosporangiaceae bacterium]